MCTPIPNLLVYSWSSMQMRYSSLRTDLPKLAGSHKKGTFTLHTGISLHFPWVENWQVTIFRWCRSILNVYTCWSYQQSSNINRFPGSFWNDAHNYISTLQHYKGFSKGYQPFTSMWLEKLLLQVYSLQIVADIVPFGSGSAPDLWPSSLRWLNRYALP